MGIGQFMNQDRSPGSPLKELGVAFLTINIQNTFLLPCRNTAAACGSGQPETHVA